MKSGSMRCLVAGVAFVLVAVMSARAEQGKTVADGVYSDAQSARGEPLYAQQCASCHNADLSGSGGPALAGPDFMGVWGKMTLADLVEKIETTMPSSAPGSLSREQSTDLVAFMLKANKFPAGAADLNSDEKVLGTITFK